MKCIISGVLLLCGILSLNADIPAGYYQRLDGKKREALKTAAFQTVRPHTVVTYNSLYPQQKTKPHENTEIYKRQRRWSEIY